MFRLRSVGSTLVVAALVIVDVFLVGVALRHTHPSNGTAGVGFGGTAAASTPTLPQSPAAAENTATVSAAQTSPVELLSTSGPQAAWRATPGCSSNGALSATSDGGKTWTKLVEPAPHILRVSMTDSTVGWVVAAGAGCKPGYWATSDGGQTWTKIPTLGKIWLADSSGVRIPDGTTARPCGSTSPTPVSLAPATEKSALVVCAKGVFVTRNGGGSWSAAGPLRSGHPLSVGVEPNGTGVLLLADAEGCSGVRVDRTTTFGRSWTVGSCLSGAVSPAAVSLDPAGDGFVVSAGRSYSSTDAGATWK